MCNDGKLLNFTGGTINIDDNSCFVPIDTCNQKYYTIDHRLFLSNNCNYDSYLIVQKSLVIRRLQIKKEINR